MAEYALLRRRSASRIQEAETMQGVLAPDGTQKEIVNLLQPEIAAILALPE
jgi:hypothetical protein